MKEKTLLKALAVTVAVPALAALASGFPGTPWSDTADSRKIAGAFNGGVTVLEPNLSGLFPPVYCRDEYSRRVRQSAPL